MRFSYNWLQSFFKKELPEPQKLAELLTMRSFEVEEVLKNGEDYILAIDILPNRASDCLSHYGLAREIAGIFPLRGISRREKNFNKFSSKKFSNETSPLQVHADKTLCLRYSAYVIRGVKITDSPDWIKKRLAAMEQKAISNIVDITNYLMWELGQPLHAFDFDKIKGSKINIRLSKQGEKLETLDGTTRDLGDEAIVIEDDERIIDLAGVKGGANTQIDNSTTKIIFQAAIFDPAYIRRTTQKLGVKTDASVRYMHGFDSDLPPQALERAVALLQETNPQARVVEMIDIYTDPVKPKQISLDMDYANKLLGTYLSAREIKQILERLGFSVTKERKIQISSFRFHVGVPSYRLDINVQEDLIEEIGRAYGYENIASESPRGALISPRRNEQVFWRSVIREILVGFGFSEVYNYSLIKKNQELGIRNRGLLELQNPTSEEFKYLRPLLLQGVLKNISFNSKNFGEIKLFEIGKVFSPEREGEKCVFAMSADRKNGEEFYRLKGYLTELFNRLGITDFYLDRALDEEEKECFSFLHHGCRANIILNNEKIGYIGEVHPGTLNSFDIDKVRVYCAEFDAGKVWDAAEEEHIYQKTSKFPEVVRDIALLVPKGTMVEEVLNVVESTGGILLRDTDLFDIYEGENLPEGKKNLAFHLMFQSDERTLTSEEVDEIMSRIYKTIEGAGWEVRE